MIGPRAPKPRPKTSAYATSQPTRGSPSSASSASAPAAVHPNESVAASGPPTRAWIVGPEPDEREQDRQGARAEGGSRRAPAERADEPLSERAGHEDAGAHPRERDADRAPTPLGEPARQEHPHRYRAQADEPNGAEDAGVEIELPGASDCRGQERGGGQEADPAE